MEHRMNLRCLLFAFVLLASNTVSSSTDCTAQNDQFECVNGDFYSFSVNPKWRAFGPMGPVSFLFEASGKHYPPVHNKAPLIVTIAVFEKPFDSLQSAKLDVVSTYSNFEDRVWEKDHRHSEKLVELESGQKAWAMSTQFYRSSKGLYQNRYELLSFAEHRETAVIFSVSIQHRDKSFAIAESLRFEKEIVNPLFSSVVLKTKG